MTGTGKFKFAMYWGAGCGGCEIAVLNINEAILDFDAAFEVVFWPAAMDAKYKDVEAMEDGSIDLTLWNGGIRNEENLEIARLLRRKSKVLVAFGSCANEGCIPGLANLSASAEIIETAYTTETTNGGKAVRPQAATEVPEGRLHLPPIEPMLRTLGQVVPVDYSMPGCPPESHQIKAVVMVVIQALRGEIPLPPAGSVLGAGDTTVCEDCPRTRNEKKIKSFTRIHLAGRLEPTVCLLEQGIPCNGPGTRSGCGALCPRAGAQCIGCYGPPAGVVDQGARLMSAMASVIDENDPDAIDQALDGIPDPAGQFYRFGLAGSLLRGHRNPEEVKR